MTMLRRLLAASAAALLLALVGVSASSSGGPAGAVDPNTYLYSVTWYRCQSGAVLKGQYNTIQGAVQQFGATAWYAGANAGQADSVFEIDLNYYDGSTYTYIGPWSICGSSNAAPDSALVPVHTNMAADTVDPDAYHYHDHFDRCPAYPGSYPTPGDNATNSEVRGIAMFGNTSFYGGGHQGQATPVYRVLFNAGNSNWADINHPSICQYPPSDTAPF